MLTREDYRSLWLNFAICLLILVSLSLIATPIQSSILIHFLIATFWVLFCLGATPLVAISGLASGQDFSHPINFIALMNVASFATLVVSLILLRIKEDRALWWICHLLIPTYLFTAVFFLYFSFSNFDFT